MISLYRDPDDEIDGERFTLTMHDPAERNTGYGSDTFSDLTEDAVREMLSIIGLSEAYADRLLQIARAEFSHATTAHVESDWKRSHGDGWPVRESGPWAEDEG
jgi:hypothetical protein